MISLYFQNFVIAPPVVVADQSGQAGNVVVAVPPNPGATIGTGSAVGDCLTDTFVVSGSGVSSPVICGTNSGQHSKTQLFCYHFPPDFRIVL